MATCPLCNAQIPDDFGLIECGSCHAPLIVHMDGKVEFSGANELAPGTRVTRTNFAKMVESELAEAPPTEMPMFDEADPAEPYSAEPAAESIPEEPDFIDDAPPVLYAQDPSAPATSASPDLSDIAQFGNSHASSTREGSLRYTIMVSGIDTSDVREMFREAITDRKMVWDTDEILRSIKNGEVKLANISPAKAFIVVARLKNLPVQVRWEQYAISQT